MYGRESHVMRVLDRFTRAPDRRLAKAGEARPLPADFRAWHFPHLAVHRWLVPLVFSLLGCSYVVWESQVADHTSLVSPSALNVPFDSARQHTEAIEGEQAAWL